MKIPLRAPKPPREPGVKFNDYEVFLSLATIPPAAPGGDPRTAISLTATPYRVLSDGTIERGAADAVSWSTGDAEGEADPDVADALTRLQGAVTKLVRRID